MYVLVFVRFLPLLKVFQGVQFAGPESAVLVGPGGYLLQFFKVGAAVTLAALPVNGN